jgi:hypothetical protein
MAIKRSDMEFATVWYEFIGALRLELYKNNFLQKWS